MNGAENRRERIGNALLTVALVALVVGAGLLLVQGRFSLSSEAAFGVAGLLLIAFIIVQPTRTRTWVTSRQVRYGSNAALMTIVLLAILGVGNILADRHPQRIDVTADRRLSLSAQTVDLLRALDGPVSVVGFFGDPSEREQANDILDQYRYHYPELEVEFYDPRVEPGRASQWGVSDTYRPTVFILYEDRRETIHFVSEREVTSALVRLTRATRPKIYFLSGHGEPALDDGRDLGLSVLGARLEEQGIEVAPLNLLITATVPSDADAVVLIGPQRSLDEDEVERLADYVDAGGAAMILLDPAMGPESESPELAAWLADQWGVAFRDDLVIDPDSYVYPLPTVPIVASYGSGPIGQGMGELETYFVEARSIAQLEAEGNPGFSPLVETGGRSWGELSREQLEAIPEDWPQYDEGVDAAGPLSIGATLEDPDTGARLVLFGDLHFCTNLAIQDLGNGDLVVNSLNWLTEDEELISIQARDEVERYVIIRSALVRNALLVVLVLLIPLAVAGVGVLVFVVRRLRR